MVLCGDDINTKCVIREGRAGPGGGASGDRGARSGVMFVIIPRLLHLMQKIN